MQKTMLPKDSFKDKVVVVTGGGSGLGKSMTEMLLRLQAKVVISSRNEEKLKKAKEELETATGGEVLTCVCDVRNPDEVEALVASVNENFGGADALVNNAAGNFISPTERLSYNAFDTILDIVLRGTRNCTLAFGKDWIDKEKQGTVLNVVTTYAWTGSAYVVPSAAAKAGVLAMTRSLAVEWAKYGIRFNAVAPGPFPTKGAWDRLLPGDLKDKFSPEKRIPLKRVGEHVELANLVSYLLSDYSAYVNGEVVTIDGGEWLQGAGQFNDLRAVPDQMWDQLEQFIRSKKK